jgi:hypothetical protein
MRPLCRSGLLALAAALSAACAPSESRPDVVVQLGPVVTSYAAPPAAAPPTRRPNFQASRGQLPEPVHVRGRHRDVLAVPGEVIVRLRPEADLAAWRAFAASLGAEIAYESPHSGAILVRIADQQGTDALLEALTSSPLVRDAAANAVAYGSAAKTTSTAASDADSDSSGGFFAELAAAFAGAFTYEASGYTWGSADPRWDTTKADFSVMPAEGPGTAPLYRYQWHLQRQWAQVAWAQSVNLGAGVRVAVLDSGVKPVTSLPSKRIKAGANFIEFDGKMRDGNGHGTHMATLIASSGVITGVAPASVIVPVRVLDDALVGTELALIEGLYFAAADPKVRVINMSLTFPAGYYPSTLMTEAIDYVAHQGVVMVAAAGNDESHSVGYPARFPEVIAVGAYAQKANSDKSIGAMHAAYSNTGGALDIAAYGGDLSTDVDGDFVPDGILGERPASSMFGAGFFLTTGTSPAAAQVSGAVALLLSEGAQPAAIRPLLQQSAYRGFSYGNFSVSDGAGLLNIGYAMECLKTGAAKATPAPLFATPALALVRSAFSDKIVPQAFIYIADDAGTPVANADVYVHFGGILDEHRAARTDSRGIAIINSPKTIDPASGFVALTVDAVVSDNGTVIARPVSAVAVDRLSYELVSNFGTGLASSAIVVDYPQSAWQGLVADISRVTPTYMLRTLGTGFTSSAIVFGFSPEWYAASALNRSTLLFRSTGTGLAGSPLAFDDAMFRNARLTKDGDQTLSVRNYTVGSGFISSAIVLDGARLAYDAFFIGTSPRIFLSSTGAGFISSAIIWDGGGLLRSSLDQGTTTTFATAPTADLGTATTSRTATYSASTVTALGQSWSDVQALYPTGTGFISSALISIYDPYRYSAAFAGYAVDSRIFQATSDAVVPFVAP